MVKHIPELEKEVENLVQRKEELLSRMSRQREDYDDYHVGKRRKAERNETSSSAAVIISSVGGEEVVVQISALKAADKGILSEALNKRELDDKLVLINASSFQSIGDRVFHSLHFKVLTMRMIAYTYPN